MNPHPEEVKDMSDIEHKVLSPLLTTGRWFVVATVIFSAVAVFTLYALYEHSLAGHAPAELEPDSYWGVHLTNFVYFIAVGFGAALVSVILRLRRTDWAAPVTRIAEVTAVLAFGVALVNIVLEVGDLNDLVDIVIYGQVDSPFIWDGLLLILFLVSTAAYMYMPMVPDLNRTALRVDYIKGFYRFLSFGYVGNPIQKMELRRMVLTMAGLVAVVLVLVSTVLAWAFDGVSPQPIWNDALTGPYFLTGAIVTALPVVIIILAIARRMYGLEEVMSKDLFARLGKGLTVAIGVFLVFFIAKTFTTDYSVNGESVNVAREIWAGEFAAIAWPLIIIGLVLPALIPFIPRLHTVGGIVLASSMAAVLMWTKGYLVVVPGLTDHLLPHADGIYLPSWTEISLMIGSLAFFGLFMMIFTRFFPIISLWEIEEQVVDEDEKEGAP
jgi:molybdopterin-containing oxidoreductase family membrane subunit